MNRSRLLKWLLARLGMQIVPSVDHLALYAAKVTAQSGQTVDVRCDDVRIGSVPKVPIQLGIPGAEVTIAVGARVLLGWRGGDPQKPFVATWESGATLTAITIRGTTVYLGDDSGANFVALANLVDAELEKVHSALSGHVHAYTQPTSGTPASTGAAATYSRASTAATRARAV